MLQEPTYNVTVIETVTEVEPDELSVGRNEVAGGIDDESCRVLSWIVEQNVAR